MDRWLMQPLSLKGRLVEWKKNKKKNKKKIGSLTDVQSLT
jgi:aspartyl aminopeptidase